MVQPAGAAGAGGRGIGASIGVSGGALEGTGVVRTDREFATRIETVAESLRDTLLRLAENVLGPALRPSKFVSRLDLDKSLASRLVRALRSSDPNEIIHFIPSPTGLRMFLDAARTQNAPAELVRMAEEAVENFQVLVDEMPGGRSALDTLISESTDEVRQRADRSAQQAVFKAMSHLLGFHCEAVSSALILQPSETSGLVDGIEVSQRLGVRRIRPNAPVALFSIILATQRSSGPAPRLEPLSSESDPLDPMSYVVERFCHPGPVPLEVFRDGLHNVFALSDSGAVLHHPVTVTSALVIRDGWASVRSDDFDREGRSYLLHYPCKLAVRDLFIREDLYVGSHPEIRLTFPNPSGSSSGTSGLPERLNTLDLWSPIETLRSPSRASVREIPEHARLLDHAFEASGWNPDRFCGYRFRMVYPVPMISTTWEIELPKHN